MISNNFDSTYRYISGLDDRISFARNVNSELQQGVFANPQPNFEEKSYLVLDFAMQGVKEVTLRETWGTSNVSGGINHPRNKHFLARHKTLTNAENYQHTFFVNTNNAGISL